MFKNRCAAFAWFLCQRGLRLAACAGLIANAPAFAQTSAVPVVSAASAAVSATASVRVPVSSKRDLQGLLDRHRTIRLEANADYRNTTPGYLVVSSGQRIEGGWNTRVPRIVIGSGVSNVVIVGVRSDGWTAPDITFTGGEPNNDIEITGGNDGPGRQIRVQMKPGSRINRLRLADYGGLDVQHAASGYLRDSVFIGMLAYWPGPHISWQGNLTEPAQRNAFLAMGSITPGPGSVLKNAGDLWLLGWDCEGWNNNDRGARNCFFIDGATRLVSVNLSGGTPHPERTGAIARIRDASSLVSWFQRGKGGRLDADATLLLDNVGDMLTVQKEDLEGVKDVLVPTGAMRMRWFGRLGSLEKPATPSPAPVLGTAQRNALTAALLASPRRAAAKPSLRVLSDAPGPAWRSDASVPVDSAATIQAEIDATGVVPLASGTYYLDRPLRLGSASRVEGLIGEDRDAVYLVANGDFPVIEGRGDFGRRSPSDTGAVVSFVLEGLTLYGGSHGIRWSGAAGQLGPGSTVAWSSFANLKFMKQRVAGVQADGIHGIDSNLWRHVDFADMPVAFRGIGQGAESGMNYADKQYFIDCQYRNISDTVWFWTSDRASGGEVWLDNYFYNVGRLTQTRAGNNLLWVNSVMENVTGPVAIHTTDFGRTATYYFTMVDSLWKGTGPAVVTDSQSWQVGTLFVDTEFAQQGGSIVANAGAQTLFAWDSRITGSATVGAVRNGVFIRSAMGAFGRTLQVVENGRSTTVIDGGP